MAMVAPQQMYSFMPPAARQTAPSQAVGTSHVRTGSSVTTYTARTFSGHGGSWVPSPMVDSSSPNAYIAHSPSYQGAGQLLPSATREHSMLLPEASPRGSPQAGGQETPMSGHPRSSPSYVPPPQESPSVLHQSGAPAAPGTPRWPRQQAPRADSSRLASARGDTSMQYDYSMEGTPGGPDAKSRRGEESRRYDGPRPVATPLGMAGARFDVPSSTKDLPAPPPAALTTGTRNSSRSPRIYTARNESETSQAQRSASPASYVPPPSSLSLMPPRRSDSFIPSSKADSFAPNRRMQSTAGSTTVSGSTAASGVQTKTVAGSRSMHSPSGSRGTSCSQSPRFESRGHPAVSYAPAPADPEDLIHQHVRYFVRQNPQVAGDHQIVRISPGLYQINGHEIEIEWQHASEVGKPGHLVVVDGPMRQPFHDYLLMNEANVEYNTHMIAKTSALHHVPKERRMTFDDTHKKYSRLEAMKVAKEQAAIREKAADFAKEGRQVPEDLVRKYNKALRQKLGKARAAPADDSPPPKERDENKDPSRNQASPADTKAAPATIAKTVGNSVTAAQGGGSVVTHADPLQPQAQPQSGAQPQPQAAGAQQAQQAPPQATVIAPPVYAWSAGNTATVHRGISLNGMPSYLPPVQVQAQAQGAQSAATTMTQPPLITRSWSGTSMSSNGTTSAVAVAQSTALYGVPGVAMQSLGSQQLSVVPPPLASARAYPAQTTTTATSVAQNAQSAVATAVASTVAPAVVATAVPSWYQSYQQQQPMGSQQLQQQTMQSQQLQQPMGSQQLQQQAQPQQHQPQQQQ